VDPAARIRELAELHPVLEIQEKMREVAAELEIQHSRLTDRMQATIGMTDLNLRDHIEQLVATLRADLDERMTNSDERQRTILEFLEALQADVQKLQERTA
jgi:hypothetical protein